MAMAVYSVAFRCAVSFCFVLQHISVFRSQLAIMNVKKKLPEKNVLKLINTVKCLFFNL